MPAAACRLHCLPLRTGTAWLGYGNLTPRAAFGEGRRWRNDANASEKTPASLVTVSCAALEVSRNRMLERLLGYANVYGPSQQGPSALEAELQLGPRVVHAQDKG